MKWEKIGEFSVDSGMFLICDPCYLIEENTQAYVPRIEEAYMKNIDDHAENVAIKFGGDHSGLAVMGNTVIGDGFFEVYSKINSKGQKEIKVVFK